MQWAKEIWGWRLIFSGLLNLIQFLVEEIEREKRDFSTSLCVGNYEFYPLKLSLKEGRNSQKAQSILKRLKYLSIMYMLISDFFLNFF